MFSTGAKTLLPKDILCSLSYHPRGAGSFPRVLGRYVREMKVLCLGEAIRKMTSLPASVFGLKGRGVLRPQVIADICIFNANTITDRATPDAPKTLSVGVRDVMVNGYCEMVG